LWEPAANRFVCWMRFSLKDLNDRSVSFLLSGEESMSEYQSVLLMNTTGVISKGILMNGWRNTSMPSSTVQIEAHGDSCSACLNVISMPMLPGNIA
jgi:hypothetical protein